MNPGVIGGSYDPEVVRDVRFPCIQSKEPKDFQSARVFPSVHHAAVPL
jgi:hypothetical protein